MALTDSKGKVAQEYQYDSFGNLHNQMNRVKQTYTYTGREWDRETGLYYYRARYYDPKVGRFISEDPIGFEGGSNFYAYVQNNPVNYTDPKGLAYIGTRPLDPPEYFPIPFNGTWKLYHAQIWYDNEIKNIGFFGNGLFGLGKIKSDTHSYWEYSWIRYPRIYDDNCMMLAVENTSFRCDHYYNIFTNNCHDFVDAVSKEYDRITQ